jgi:hypothetical protein
MLFGELVRANSFGMAVEQVHRLAKFWLVFGDQRPRQDHTGPTLGEMGREPLPKSFTAPETGS